MLRLRLHFLLLPPNQEDLDFDSADCRIGPEARRPLPRALGGPLAQNFVLALVCKQQPTHECRRCQAPHDSLKPTGITGDSPPLKDKN